MRHDEFGDPVLSHGWSLFLPAEDLLDVALEVRVRHAQLFYGLPFDRLVAIAAPFPLSLQPGEKGMKPIGDQVFIVQGSALRRQGSHDEKGQERDGDRVNVLRPRHADAERKPDARQADRIK